jgi:hypothetical protein
MASFHSFRWEVFWPTLICPGKTWLAKAAPQDDPAAAVRDSAETARSDCLFNETKSGKLIAMRLRVVRRVPRYLQQLSARLAPAVFV